MALLDFMKQGTQWLTDNTGMDWNTVQRDPGLAAKRLMGGEVSPYQAQPQPTQNNLLATPENIVVDPSMQNRVTYNNPEFTPDYRTVQNTTNFDYTPTIDGGYNLPIRTFEDKAENARANANSLYGNYQDTNGYDRNRKEAQVLNFDNRVTYQNLPQKKADYEAGLIAEDKLYGDYPMTGFTEIAPGLRASEQIKGGYSEVDLINEDNQRKFEEEQNDIKQAEKDKESFEFNPHPNRTPDTTPKETSWLDSLMWGDDSNGAAMMEYFRNGGDRKSVVDFDQSYKTNEFNPNDGSSGNSGDQGVFDTVVNFGRGIFSDEGEASDSKDPVLANTAPKDRDAYLKLRQDEQTAIQIDALDIPDARKIELYNQKGIPVPDKYGMKGLISKK